MVGSLRNNKITRSLNDSAFIREKSMVDLFFVR